MFRCSDEICEGVALLLEFTILVPAPVFSDKSGFEAAN